MNLTDINREQMGRWLALEQQEPFTAIEQYLYSYFDAAFRHLATFEYARLAQAKIIVDGQIAESMAALMQVQNHERQCALAIEAVYVYIHRIEAVVRKNSDLQDRILAHQTMDKNQTIQFFTELRFMSEVRNKVIEHAPENLSFQSKWGQAFNANDPFDYRLWILHPDAHDILHNNKGVVEAIDKACLKIHQFVAPNPMPIFGKLFDVTEGASHLDTTDIRYLFRDALTTVGCISHTPERLAAKLCNLTVVNRRYDWAGL